MWKKLDPSLFRGFCMPGPRHFLTPSYDPANSIISTNQIESTSQRRGHGLNLCLNHWKYLDPVYSESMQYEGERYCMVTTIE